MASPRSLAMLVGIPAVYGFGSSPRVGSDGSLMGSNEVFSLETQNAGSGFFPNLIDDPRYKDTWDADLCSQLDTIKVLTDNEWCGSRKSEDACTPALVLRLGGGTAMTVSGLAMAYDVCAWDYETSSCRLAPMSFYCNVENCPQPPNVDFSKIPRSAGTSGVDCRTKCSKKALPSKSQFGFDAKTGGFTEVFRVAETCTTLLYRNGRRLQEPAPKVETRRKLVDAACPANAVTHTMTNGGICCDTTNVELAPPFQEDLTNPALYDVKEGCTYDSANDVCKCEVVTEPTGEDADPCPTIGPSNWVASA